MSEREEMIELILPILEKCFDSDWNMTYSEMVTDALTIAGYRKPRTITTAEELDALPGSAVVKDALGQVFEKQEAGQWYDGPHDWLAFDGKFWDVDAIHLPATVLYEPEPQP